MADIDMRSFANAPHIDIDDTGSSKSKLIAAAIVAIGLGTVGAYTYYSNTHHTVPVQQVATNEPQNFVAHPAPVTPPPAPPQTQQAAPDQQPVTAPDTATKTAAPASPPQHVAHLRTPVTHSEPQAVPQAAPAPSIPDTAPPEVPQQSVTPQTAAPQTAAPDTSTTTAAPDATQQPQQPQAQPDQTATPQ